jgi:hypothetical protein
MKYPAGIYVAILNKTNFDGHYARIFEFPGFEETEPSWYYLNRIDYTGCLVACYPIEIFDEADIITVNQYRKCVVCNKWRHLRRGDWFDMEVFWATNGIQTICPQCANCMEPLK